MSEHQLSCLVRIGNGVKKRYGLYRCVCGAEKDVYDSSVKSKATQSCGCLSRKLTSARNAKRTIHGKTRTPEYKAWQAMKDRCLNTKHKRFKDWGGRGITVAAEWVSEGGFELFFAHIGLRPSLKHSIDRIKNDKGYEPGNVRWATSKEQANNRRNTKWSV